MAQFPGITLTNAGLNMIAESQASSAALIFTSLKIGDGTLTIGEDVKVLTAIKSPKLTVPPESYTNDGGGQVRLRFAISNGSLATGFFARELGIYAKIGATGAEQLYAYTNAGNLTDYIPDKTTPIDEQIIDIYLIVGNASSVSIVRDGSIIYVSKAEFDEHKVSTTAHPEAFNEHNTNTSAHEDIREMIEKTGMPIGSIMPWLVTAVPAGWLALDTGALVSRTTYSQLWAWVQANAPLITEAEWQAQAAVQTSIGAYSSGDGATTFRLPRIVDFVCGSDSTKLPGTWRKGSITGFDSTGSSDGRVILGYGADGGGGNAELFGMDAINAANYSGVTAYGVAASLASSQTLSAFSGSTRPKSIAMLYCVKAFDAPTNQALIDITALANEVVGKVNYTDYESWGNDTNGGMKYPDGHIEQWGTTSVSAAGIAVVFSIPFPNAVNFVGANVTASISGSNDAIECISQTLTGFTAACASGTGNAKWFAKGR
ncbi:MAG: hypothetical protein H6Q72_1472 [Firmicutes bacterium]|nr:hypothetical protein [Bacillota bacterium]